MSSIKATAEPFFDACETGKGWAVCADAHYELKSRAVDDGRHTTAGGPVPPTSVPADYVYVMEFDGDRIRHQTKIWNDGVSLRQLGWG